MLQNYYYFYYIVFQNVKCTLNEKNDEVIFLFAFDFIRGKRNKNSLEKMLPRSFSRFNINMKDCYVISFGSR